MKLNEDLKIDKKVLVALSGGLDSAATVLMLRAMGYNVSALYLDITGSKQSLERAQEVALAIGVELQVERVQQEFQLAIIDDILQQHSKGYTPSPCARCNPLIKWKILCMVADRLGIFHVATGHYVRTAMWGQNMVVKRGVDNIKDQSYYLWALSSKTLERAILPLGEFTKLQVREYLHSRGYVPLSGSSESMSLCFLGGYDSYSEFLRSNLTLEAGEVVDTKDRKIGTHCGYQLYTIGQKRGFETSEKPQQGAWEIKSINTDTNTLIVTDNPAELYTTNIHCTDVICSDLERLIKSPNVKVVVRGLGRNPEGFASSIRGHGDSELTITLPAPGAWAVAPGQPVVLYIDDMVVAGGYVSKF